jgi:hypothetical protein
LIESDTRQANWRRANPEKYACHIAAAGALLRGQLVKQPCEVCGATEEQSRIDAHHSDYSKPLEVRWLCRAHHVRLHAGGEDMFRRDAA